MSSLYETNREDYIKDLALAYNIDLATVEMMADLFGPEEDFDGLVNFCEDHENEHYAD